MFSGDWESSIPVDPEVVDIGAKRIRDIKRDFRERIEAFEPVGAIEEWDTETEPDGWMECDGSSLAVATYPDLFARLGYRYGGSGANFNIPNIRGLFVRCFPDGETGLDLDADNATSCTGDISGTAITSVTGLAGCPRIGAEISGTGIPSGTTITALADFDADGIPESMTISQSASSGTGVALTINNMIIGSVGYDANKKHKHYYDGTDPSGNGPYLGGLSSGPVWSGAGLLNDSSSQGDAEARPKNKTSLFMIKLDESAATYTNSWDETIPEDDLLDGLSEAGKVDELIRQLKLDIHERILKHCPVGLRIKWTSDLIPPGFMECNGDSLLRTDYPVLFGIIGTVHGAADSSHFNLPNWNGYFSRGWNNGRSSGPYDPDAATRTKVTETGATMSSGDHVGTLEQDQNRAHMHEYYYKLGTGGHGAPIALPGVAPYEITKDMEYFGSENRPINKNIKYIIRVDGIDDNSEIFSEENDEYYKYIREWSESSPINTLRMGRIVLELRKFKKDIEERIVNFMPPGKIIYWPTDVLPDGYLKANGDEISRTTYSDLFDWIGDMYGPGDGLTTFNLPDYRGWFLRAQDGGTGIDEGSRTDRGDGVIGDYVGTEEDDDVKNHNHTFTGYGLQVEILGSNESGIKTTRRLTDYTIPAYREVDGHPKNMYLLALIKAVAI